MTVLRLQDVRVVAGSTTILDGVTLDVPRGRIVAIVGSNGAGKTTLLDAISGVAPGITGMVEVGGRSDAPRPGFPRTGVGRVFQGSPLPETMTVGEVIGLVAGGRAGARAVLQRFGLAAHETTFVAELSTGMRRILDLAVASVGSPAVLLLDEPASGLAQAEIEHLAEVIKQLRDETGAAVLLVEHDAWLVKAVADELIVMDEGRIVVQGTPEEVLAAPRTKTKQRVASPHDDRFTQALERVATEAVPSPPLVRRSLSTWTILRLGLREFAAGVGSVLILGVLSRVLKVDLRISLGTVTAILATYNLAAPLGLPIGHWSDTRPIRGLRRTPYILVGALVTGLAVAAAPHVAGSLRDGITPFAVTLSVGLFVMMGIGMYGSGTVFFALLSDLAGPGERGHVAKVIYLELLAGVFFGVALTGAILPENAEVVGGLPRGTTTLFALAGFSIFVLTALAVIGHERRGAAVVVHERVRFRQVLAETARMRQARVFFAYMVASTFFFFIQQAIVQPFGGDVFGMTIQQTGGLTAMVTLGTVIGMVVAGRPFASQLGHLTVTRWGLRLSIGAFAALALAAGTRSVPGVWLSLLAIGLTLGVWNVAGLGLMMDMVTRARAAFFMGAWTVAHALADGLSTASGGIIFSIARWVTGSTTGGYATIFAVEAIGIALCLPLLRRVDPERFIREAAEHAAHDAAPGAPTQAGMAAFSGIERN